MHHWLANDTEALALGDVVVPNILLITYFIQHYRISTAAIPLIIFYTAIKAIPFALRSFGHVSNPYRLLVADLIVALTGAIFLLFRPLLVGGALLLGCGLATFKPAYQALKDEYRRQGRWQFPRAALVGIVFLLVYLVISFALGTHAFNWGVVMLILLIGLALIFVCHLPSPWLFTRPFFTGPLIPRRLATTLLILLLALGVRGIRQTGNLVLIGVTLASWVILLFNFSIIRSYRPARLWTIWLGASNNFLLIYSLFLFTVQNKSGELAIAYGLYILAMIGGLVIAGKCRSHSSLVLTGTLVSLAVTLIPSNGFFLLGLFGTALFSSIIGHYNVRAYTTDPDIAPLNCRFIRNHFNILGAILSQVVLLASIIIVNLLFDHHGRQILASYFRAQSNQSLVTPLWYVRCVCLVLLAITALLIFCQNKKPLDENHQPAHF